jgi:hypothetical protein
LPGVVLGSGIGTNMTTLATQAGLAAGSYAINGALLTNVSGFKGTYDIVRDFGAIPNDGIDDSTALQNAINYAVTLEQTITVMVPNGVYNISTNYSQNPGTGNGAYAQIHLPTREYNTVRTVGIRLIGMTAPQFNMNWTTNAQDISTNGAIFISTNVPSLSGNAANTNTCVFGYPNTAGTTWGYTAYSVYLENLTFRMRDQPPASCLNFKGVGEVSLKMIQVDTGTKLSAITQPTNYANSCAIFLPGYANWTICNVEDVSVTGYARGVVTGEHGYINNLSVWLCITGMEIGRGGHGNFFGKTLIAACKTNVVVTHTSKVAWALYSAEDEATANYIQPSWVTNFGDIYDPSNSLRGTLSFSILQGGGAESSFRTTAGLPYVNTNMAIVSLYNPALAMVHPTDGNYGRLLFGQPNSTVSGYQQSLPSFWHYTAATFGGPYVGWNVPAGGSQINNLANSANLLVMGGNGNGVLLQSSALQFGSHTNGTPPSNTSIIRAWVNYTNATGGQFKMPLYQ